jgi:ATP-binding cassette subfamily B protein/ATP-binding cassette subfamily C protein
VAASAGQAFDAGVRVARLQAMVGPAVTTAIQGGFLAVLGIGGARVASGVMSVGDLVAFVLFLFLLMMPVAQAMNAYTQLQAGLGALQRIEDMLVVPTETAADPPAPVAEPLPDPPAIEFDRVSFAYADGEPVLHGVSFAVPTGTRTALVGPSGAGKSTALALVERFYDNTGGAVRVNGLDVRDQPRALLRAQLGYVEQEAPVLAGTIRDNLLLAAPDASEDQLLAALATVNLSELVERTPEGLDAQVGEGGVLLSGGERQRLAIARTLLAGAPILLLDEPTSNLDSRNEHALRQAINAAATRRTLLVVAHRLSTVVDADQIVVLDRGRVAAIGKHHELAGTNPLYRELATHQLLVD